MMADKTSSEFNPSGKQLVFLFMASTVVAVIVFLCGVMVGRGVPIQRGFSTLSPTDARSFGSFPEQVNDDLDLSDEFNDNANLTYYRHLGTDESLDEEFGSGDLIRESEQIQSDERQPESRVISVIADEGNQAGDNLGFTVQVVALRGRTEADVIVGQLAAKGYPAYMLEPAPNTPARVYRVRVGRYRDRWRAEEVLRRLEEEEQFKPWITR